MIIDLSEIKKLRVNIKIPNKFLKKKIMKIKRKFIFSLIILIPSSFVGIFFFKDIDVLKNSFRKFIQETITEENRGLVKKFLLPFREIDILKNLYKSTAS